MQIGLDLRFLNDDLYSKFIINLVINLIIINKDDSFIIYINDINKNVERKLKEIISENNAKLKKINIKNASFKEQTTFLKILNEDKNTILIFFNHFKPLLYKWEYYVFIPSLKDIYYGDFNSLINKYKYLFLLEKNIKNARKVLCFDDNTKNELIEKFDLKEEKIFINQWSFIEKQITIEDEYLKLDIKTKYWITNDYFIYSGWDWIEKNLDKLIWLFTKIEEEIDLIMIWDDISKNIELRNLIIKYSIQHKIKFINPTKDTEKYLIYKSSIWVIFPSLYETFPFHLWDAIHYNTPIIASNLKNIKEIFTENINYFSPISKSCMLDNINLHIKQKKKNVNYNNIKEKFYIKNATQNLLEIIK